jgi:hypothetical protein
MYWKFRDVTTFEMSSTSEVSSLPVGRVRAPPVSPPQAATLGKGGGETVRKSAAGGDLREGRLRIDIPPPGEGRWIILPEHFGDVTTSEMSEMSSPLLRCLRCLRCLRHFGDVSEMSLPVGGFAHRPKGGGETVRRTAEDHPAAGRAGGVRPAAGGSFSLNTLDMSPLLRCLRCLRHF